MKSKAEKMKDLAIVRRRKVVIQKKGLVKNEIGDLIEGWVDWKTLRAERSNLYGEDFYAAAAVNQEQTIEFKVKYVAFLDGVDTVGYRLKYEGKAYNIKQVDHLQDDGMFAKIKALESEL